MKVVIIKYNAGNIMSVDFALQRLGIQAEVTDDIEKIKQADKVIFPGVGEASTTMSYLRQHKLNQLIVDLKQPVLGICLGLQLMCSHSEEGDTDCLGIFPEQVRKFIPEPGNQFITKVPHMGWNNLAKTKSPLFDADIENQYVYFVHSYYLEAEDASIVTAEIEYGTKIDASVESGNIFACQFHPEKSSEVGLKILDNFLKIKGKGN